MTMSLSVSPYKRDPLTGEMEGLTEQSLSVGFERWRWHLWGSEVVRSFSCVLLSSLEQGDIYAEGADLDKLEAEASLLLQHVELIVARTGIEAFSPPQQEGGPGLFVGAIDEDTVTSQRWRAQGGAPLLRVHLNNILTAVRIAKEHGEGRGGVCIG